MNTNRKPANKGRVFLLLLLMN